jgi:hypothetical protein
LGVACLPSRVQSSRAVRTPCRRPCRDLRASRITDDNTSRSPHLVYMAARSRIVNPDSAEPYLQPDPPFTSICKPVSCFQHSICSPRGKHAGSLCSCITAVQGLFDIWTIVGFKYSDADAHAVLRGLEGRTQDRVHCCLNSLWGHCIRLLFSWVPHLFASLCVVTCIVRGKLPLGSWDSCVY